MIIYEVRHIHDIADTISPEIKHLGFFSKYTLACSVIENRRNVIGFKDYPNGFMIIPRYFDSDVAQQIYLLDIAIHDEDYDYDYEETIGLYKSYQDAMDAKLLFCTMNENRIMKTELTVEIDVHEAKIDYDQAWLYGFVTEYHEE